MLNVQDMTKAVDNHNVNFMLFTRIHAKRKDALVCCFEGKDNAYYGIRITENLNGAEWEGLCCKGKEQVLELYHLLGRHKDHLEYRNAKKAFFVDRDFDPPLPEKVRKDVYETPCYSIENFYTTEKCFRNIIKNGFNIHEFQDDDSEIFKKCMEYFTASRKKFHNKASALNAWIMIIREKERQKCVSDREKLNLNNIKFDDLFSVEVDRVTSSYNTDSLNSHFDGDDIGENKIRERENIFSGKDRGCLFRGKYEIAFLTKFLRKIQDDLCCRSPTYFPEKRKVSFNFTDGNILSELSRFADTPQCLRDYLKDIKDKYYAQSDC